MRRYEWHFARLLNTPPNALAELTIEQFLTGRQHVDAIQGGAG